MLLRSALVHREHGGKRIVVLVEAESTTTAVKHGEGIRSKEMIAHHHSSTKAERDAAIVDDVATMAACHGRVHRRLKHFVEDRERIPKHKIVKKRRERRTVPPIATTTREGRRLVRS